MTSSSHFPALVLMGFCVLVSGVLCLLTTSVAASYWRDAVGLRGVIASQRAYVDALEQRADAQRDLIEALGRKSDAFERKSDALERLVEAQRMTIGTYAWTLERPPESAPTSGFGVPAEQLGGGNGR